MTIRCGQLKFTPSVVPTLGFILLLPLLIGLGFWQLARASYHENQFIHFQRMRYAEPINLDVIKKTKLAAVNFQPIKGAGFYDSKHQFLVDNQFYQHQVGFLVLTPFRYEENHWVIVNRGWIAHLQGEALAQEIKIVDTHQSLQGNVLLPPKKIFVLSKKIDDSQWPIVLPAMDLKKISELLNQPLDQWIILLDRKNKYSFVSPKVAETRAQKNYAYAIQWFSLALTLVIIYLITNLHREDHGSET